MNGKIIGLFLLGCGVLAGAAMYYLQVYAYYEEVAFGSGVGEVRIRMTPRGGQEPVELSVQSVRGIDSRSSPIRFRACFEVDDPEAVAASAVPVPEAVPLNAPGWFDCFDASEIGDDLASGAATAVLGEANVTYGVDRILAIYPDGLGFAWHQINRCGEEVFDGRPPPEGCPPPE